MSVLVGDPADGTLPPMQEGEKEYLFRMVLFPQASLFNVGVFRGFSMEHARTLFMQKLTTAGVPLPRGKVERIELWVNELMPVRKQETFL